MILPLYDLNPRYSLSWIAPNATIIGEVCMSKYCSIWHRVVLRGDINRIMMGEYVSIGENTVVYTCGSLPDGRPSEVLIGNNTTIGNGCTLHSCEIGNKVFIGDKCIVMEGAKIEEGAMLAPGSVVPPGRLIPAK